MDEFSFYLWPSLGSWINTLSMVLIFLLLLLSLFPFRGPNIRGLHCCSFCCSLAHLTLDSDGDGGGGYGKGVRRAGEQQRVSTYLPLAVGP